jgi:hypothetical protein
VSPRTVLVLATRDDHWGLFRDEIAAYLYAEPDADERGPALTASRATGLEIVAFDHGVTQDGGHVVCDADPYPGVLS